MNQNEIGDGYRLGEEDYVAKAGYAGRINISRQFKSSIWSGQGTEGDTGKRFQFIHGRISAFQDSNKSAVMVKSLQAMFFIIRGGFEIV